MAQNRVNMPASTAGLTRYFEDYKSKFEFKPGHVILLSVIVVIITVLLHMYGGMVLGLS